MMHVVHRGAGANMQVRAIESCEAGMSYGNPDFRSDTFTSSDRRRFIQLFAGASLALGGAALAGCANMDMRADPPKPRPKTMIIGRGSGPGGGPGR